jgi:hypothetical protein
MSISTGGLYRVLHKYPNLNLDKLLIIGWGAGQFFTDYYPLIKSILPIKHTICPIKSNHGKLIHGVKVISPLELKKFDSQVLIVIFSNHSSIVMNQIRDEFGDIPVISSMEINSDPALSMEVDGFFSASIYSDKFIFHHKTPLFGIVVQGLIYEYTPKILAWNKLKYPDSYQCMVTWDHQPTSLIEKCLPWLDELKLVKQPEVLGPFLFNTSIKSCKIGLQIIADKNIKYSVRTRSDSLLVGSIYSVLDKYFTRNRNKSKIAICVDFGWKNVPFLFSDRLMVGHTNSLINAWSIKEFDFNTNFTNFIADYGDHDLQNMGHIMAESLFWRDFASRLNYPNEKLIDSYNFARDILLPLNPLLTHKSIKLFGLFDVALDNNISFDVNSWDQLYTNFDDFVVHSKFIDENNFQLKDLLAKRIG